jgi:ribosomal protein S18 acetylase RimI-like enzyme
MRVRPAESSDARAVTALWTEAYSGRGPGGRQTPYEQSEFFDSLARGELFVAELEAGVVGAVALHGPGAVGRAVAVGEEAELSRLAVAAAARGCGIGRALARLCGERAAARAASGVVLWSRPYQVEAHRLYESLGYRRAAERDSDDADGRRLVFRLQF